MRLNLLRLSLKKYYIMLFYFFCVSVNAYR